MLLVDDHIGDRQVLGEAPFGKPTITIRELLHARVDLELEAVESELREEKDAQERSAVSSTELRLNGPAKALRSSLFALGRCGEIPGRDDLRRVAEQGFSKGRFFVLLDDHQAESLDDTVELEKTVEATFLLLTPLQGG